MNSLKNTRILFLFAIALLFSQYAAGQVCKDSTLLYGYGASEPVSNGGGSMTKLTNGNIATFARPLISTSYAGIAGIALSDASGRFIKAKYFSTNASIFIYRIAATTGGGLLLYGKAISHSGYNEGIILIKLNNQLDILWSRYFTKGDQSTTSESYFPLTICSDESGKVYLSFHTYDTDEGVFAAVDSNGNLLWSRSFFYEDVGTRRYSIYAATTINNKVCFMGSGLEAGANPMFLNFIFEKQTGVLISVNKTVIKDIAIETITSIQGEVNHFDNVLIKSTSTGFFFAIPTRNTYLQNNLYHLFIDSTLNVQQINKISGVGYANPKTSQFAIKNNGELLFSGGKYSAHNQTNCIGAIDKKGNVLFSKKLQVNGYFPNPVVRSVAVLEHNNSYMLAICDYPAFDTVFDTVIISNSNYFFNSTTASCGEKDSLFFSVSSTGFKQREELTVLFYSGTIFSFPIDFTSTEFSLQKKEYCKVVSECSEAIISGDNNFCTATLQTFKCKTNPGCLKKIIWNADSLPANIVGQTDSTISLIFDSSWQGNLVATAGDCSYASDSINLAVYRSAKELFIGRDTVICPGEQIVLNAQSGFVKYQWSTGETTSAISVTDTNLYMVKVTDYCGNTKEDTIHVAYKLPLFPTVELGTNQYLCPGKTITLSTAPGFASYLWSTGAGTASITVNMPGQYSVTVKDVCGNEASDMIEILQPGKLFPQFSLGVDTVLCTGASLFLSTPPGFASYQWSSGQTSENISVYNPGKYFVTVNDVCGNSFSDTIIIKSPDKVFPSINDESICFKDSLFIRKEAGFINYTWQPSAGNMGDTLFFLNPDVTTTYTVQVQDGDGCSWKKNFVLAVEKCIKNFWMPTGFTPNKDGLNDELGPKIEGRLQSYSFKVFNRWGGLVFNSNNPANKWNGKLHGVEAPGGVYVWMCNYQFRHEAAAMEKGTVILIR